MQQIYRVVIRGRVIESSDLRRLLSRAVREKRDLNRILRSQAPPLPGPEGGVVPAHQGATRTEDRPAHVV